jgi:electron transfer flavoprotein alpha subunit
MGAKVDEKKCIGCGICTKVCPVGAIQLRNGKAKVSDGCISCGACAGECPMKAIDV